MMQFLQNIGTVLGIAIGIYLFYFGIIALRGLYKSTTRHALQHFAPRKRIACVIAARNEQAVIGHLIDSLLAQDYPQELFDIIVAPNNCTDATEAVAQSRGARIFHAKGVIRGKGQVLTQLVDEIILKEPFDAMCVFDADNLVCNSFLSRMNDALCAGADAVQGFRDSKNPEQTAISGCYSICYWMLNRFYNAARASLGLSALINGSGFAVSTDLLRDLDGWHTVTMTEDFEFSAQCALRDKRIYFVDDAVIYDEQPLTFRQSWHQRRRWTTGGMQSFQAYALPLLVHTLTHRSLISFDMFLTFCMPLIQLISVIAGLLALPPTIVSSGLVLGDFVLHGFLLVLAILTVSTLFSIAATLLAAILTVILKNGSTNGMWRGITSFWLFSMSQTLLILLSFIHKETTWRPIVHTNAKSLSDIEP